MKHADDELRDILNAETGKLGWPELERHFARGVVINVAAELDLVDVAVSMAKDDRAAFNQWLECAKVSKASTDDARGWVARQPVFWAVVVAPWVLVQEIRD